MMKYLALMFAVLVGAISCVYAQATRSAAASQAWVSNYVAQAVANITAATLAKSVNGVAKMSIADGELVIEHTTDAALRVQNSVCAVTNGTLFIWSGENKFVNRDGIIEATKTNMVYKGTASTPLERGVRFAGYFDAVGVLVTAKESLAVTNGMEVVR